MHFFSQISVHVHDKTLEDSFVTYIKWQKAGTNELHVPLFLSASTLEVLRITTALGRVSFSLPPLSLVSDDCCCC